MRSGECGNDLLSDCRRSETVEHVMLLGFKTLYAEIASAANHAEAHINRFLLGFPMLDDSSITSPLNMWKEHVQIIALHTKG